MNQFNHDGQRNWNLQSSPSHQHQQLVFEHLSLSNAKLQVFISQRLLKFNPEAYTVSHIIAERKIHPADPTNAYPEFPGTAVREVVRETVESAEVNKQRLSSEDIIMTPIQPKEYRPVPTLEHGLDRVLFKYSPYEILLMIVLG